MNNQVLQQITVMVTRPKPSGEILCDMIQQAGGTSIFFPMIEIVPLTHSPIFYKAITELDALDWLIFISPQAVYQTAVLIKTQWPCFPPNVKVAALGGGTAFALQEAGIPLHLYPKTHWNSEGLLALPDFQEIKGKKIALVHGVGGRDVLAHTLTSRGAKLIHLIAYQRSKPSGEAASYLSLLQDKKIDIIICTSNDILQNLNTLLGQQARDIYTIPLIVISGRMVLLAKKIGFQTILLAENANNDVIMTALKDYICQIKLRRQSCQQKYIQKKL
jgi:uroporphyrinogen-III synthase